VEQSRRGEARARRRRRRCACPRSGKRAGGAFFQAAMQHPRRGPFRKFSTRVQRETKNLPRACRPEIGTERSNVSQSRVFAVTLTRNERTWRGARRIGRCERSPDILIVDHVYSLGCEQRDRRQHNIDPGIGDSKAGDARPANQVSSPKRRRKGFGVGTARPQDQGRRYGRLLIAERE